MLVSRKATSTRHCGRECRPSAARAACRLTRTAQAEEQVMYPALQSHCGPQGALLAEHAGREHRELSREVSSGGGSAWAAACGVRPACACASAAAELLSNRPRCHALSPCPAGGLGAGHPAGGPRPPAGGAGGRPRQGWGTAGAACAQLRTAGAAAADPLLLTEISSRLAPSIPTPCPLLFRLLAAAHAGGGAAGEAPPADQAHAGAGAGGRQLGGFETR